LILIVVNDGNVLCGLIKLLLYGINIKITDVLHCGFILLIEKRRGSKMKTFKKLILIMMVCLMSSFPYTNSSGNMHKDDHREIHGFLYNPEKQEMINGEVISLEDPVRGWCEAVHMTVQTEKGPVLVHLTSRKYITDKGNSIVLKDKVEVKGSRSFYGDEQVFIAAEVTKGNSILKIWDDKEGLFSIGWIKK